MDAYLIGHLLSQRHSWRQRDRWTREQLLSHQQAQLDQLRARTLATSKFYRLHHKGREGAPLSALPPVTKSMLMQHWDEAVTTPDMSKQVVDSWLDSASAAGVAGLPYGGKWFAARTGGTSGNPGVFAWNRREWVDVVTSYARANDWAGIEAGVTHPLRTALVSSHDPAHQSAVVGASLKSPLVPTLRLDAGDPMDDQVSAIEEFGPRLLVGYASAMRAFAEARLGGAMANVHLDGVVSASEVLTQAARDVIADAWGVPVIDVYASTETAGIASPCTIGTKHLYEDLLILEPVDDDYQPVADGETGSQLLVTVLFSKTLPLIRYVMDDRVAIGPPGCACGRPHAVLTAVEGRSEDVLTLPGTRGAMVSVAPIVFHHGLDTPARGAWQVMWDGRGIDVRVVSAHADTGEVTKSLTQELLAHGVKVPVTTSRVLELERTRLGKLRLIKDNSN